MKGRRRLPLASLGQIAKKFVFRRLPRQTLLYQP